MVVPPQLAGKYQGEEQDEHRWRQGAAIFFRARRASLSLASRSPLSLLAS